MKNPTQLFLIAIFTLSVNIASAQCKGIFGTADLSFTNPINTVLPATPTPNVASTSVWKFAHVATIPVDIDAIVTLTSFTVTGPDSTKVSWNNIDYTASGYADFIQPSWNTLSGNWSSLTNPTVASSTFNIQFVLTGTSTPYFSKLLVNSIDIDGDAGANTKVRETVTYYNPTTIQVGTPTLLTLIGNTFIGPYINQAGIGTAEEYNGYVYYLATSYIDVTYRDTIRFNGSQGNSLRLHSTGFGCPFTSVSSFVEAGMSGTIYNDVNGLTNSNVDGVGIGNTGTQLYVNLLNASGIVIESLPVDSNGSYNFTSITPNTTYTVQLTTNKGTVGSPAPAIALPTGWINTSETTISGGVETGSAINSSIAVTTGASGTILSNNFGIEQPPIANTTVNNIKVNTGAPINITNSITGTDPSIGGTIDSLKIKFPTAGAASITINGTTYTATQFATAFPSGVATVTFGTSILVTPISISSTLSIVVPVQVVDNAGAISNIATITQPMQLPSTVSGNVFNDPNAGTVNNSSLVTNLVPSGLNAVIIDTITGLVIATTSVNTNGTYNFPRILPGNYKMELTTNTATVGALPPAVALPNGWVNDGEFNGTNGKDNLVNSYSASFNVDLANVSNINFAIEQPPIASSITMPISVNPGSANTKDITSSFGGTDFSNGVIDSLKIKSFPTNAKSITINGIIYDSISFPLGGVIVHTNALGVPTSSVLLEPKNGDITVDVPFVVYDNAGVVSSLPAEVHIPFKTVTISGNMFNDPNGGNVNNSTGIANTVPSGLYVNLINSDNLIVQSVPVNANGTYSFNAINGGVYNVILDTTLGVQGAIAPTPTIISCWANTGEYNGLPNSGTDALINGTTTTFTVSAGDVANINFGIDQSPFTDTMTVSIISNPGANFTSNITNFFGGADSSNGKIDNIKITTFPANLTSITINNILYTSSTFPTGGLVVATNPTGVPTTPILIDPIDGNVNVTIPYLAIDNAGVISTMAGFVSVPFKVFTPLGLQILNFFASNTNDCNINLKWTTTEELNVQSIIILQSINNAKTFQEIGEVEPKGNNSTYTFESKKDFQNTTFYKLKINFKNGNPEFSNTIAVTKCNNESGVKIYPNPTNNYLNILLQDKVNGYSFKIYNQLGAVVKEEASNNEINNININVSSFAKGIYYIKLNSATINTTSVFTID